MDLLQTTTLLEKISVHYPTFGRRISGQDGFISYPVVEEWNRSIGYLDLEEALRNLDRYLEEGHKTAPAPMDLRNNRKKATQPQTQTQLPTVHKTWTVKRGRLYDGDGYEYTHDPTYTGRYHYDTEGRIATDDGTVINL